MNTAKYTPHEKQANCKACTLGRAMKDCVKCPFYTAPIKSNGDNKMANTTLSYLRIEDGNAEIQKIKSRLFFLAPDFGQAIKADAKRIESLEAENAALRLALAKAEKKNAPLTEAESGDIFSLLLGI